MRRINGNNGYRYNYGSKFRINRCYTGNRLSCWFGAEKEMNMGCNASMCPETEIKYYVRTWELDEKGLPGGHIDQAYCKFHRPTQYKPADAVMQDKELEK